MPEESWKECVKWLQQCQAIPPDHKLTRNDGKLTDLANYLEDGVVVCQLLNRLYPQAIDPKSFSQRPQHSQYLRKKNFRAFLNACKNVFDLKDSDICSTQDLYEKTDFEKFIHTLSKISQTDVARRLVPVPFILNNRGSKTYSSLNSDAEEAVADEDYVEEYGDDDDDDDKIYDYLMHDEERQQRPLQKSKKDMCINELMHTEKKYIENLCLIKTHFMDTLFSVLEQDEMEKIFFKIKDFIEIHSGFYGDLHQANDSSGQDIFRKATSDCFITWKERFLIYGEYCSNLTSAQELIESLCGNSEQLRTARQTQVMTAIENCQMAAYAGNFKLRDVLTIPMQRILKYSLLLQEMVKSSEPDDPEKKMLERALDEMKDMSLYVNEVKRDNENLELINEIEKSIVDLKMPADTQMKDYGHLQMDGGLKFKLGSNAKISSRNVFLFDKIMILCKSKNDVIYYKDCLIIAHYVLDDTLPVKDVKDKAFAHGFVMKRKDDAGSYRVFGAKSSDLRSKWIEAIELAQNNRSPPDASANGHQFVMTSYDKPTICDVCRKLLRGVFFQGYKCQKTNMSVHKECIRHALNMKGPPTLIPPPPPGRRPSVPGLPTAAGRVNVLHSCSSERPQLSLEKNPAERDVISDKKHIGGGHCQMLSSSLKYPRNMRTGRRNTEPALSAHAILTLKYRDVCLENYLWYVGDVSKDELVIKIEQRPNGTFLVRPSEKGGYALTIMFNGAKHIKIQEKDGMFSIDDQKYFSSIPDLIEHHEKVSLQSSFADVPKLLSVPFRETLDQPTAKTSESLTGNANVKYCEAIYDYAATESNQLSIRVGDMIAIVGKAGDTRGWCRGRLNGKTGFFPYTYVKEV